MLKTTIMLAVLATAACAPSYSVPASYWNSNHYYEVEKDIARKQVALDADLTDLYGQAGFTGSTRSGQCHKAGSASEQPDDLHHFRRPPHE